MCDYCGCIERYDEMCCQMEQERCVVAYTKVMATAGDSVPSEIAYFNSGNELIGLWICGNFHPGYPYTGNDGKLLDKELKQEVSGEFDES